VIGADLVIGNISTPIVIVRAIWCAWVAVVAMDNYVMRMTRRQTELRGEKKVF
jgi:hypothetical protein